MPTPSRPPAQAGEPIRIARLIARLNVGGPAIHVVLLTSRLRERGYETTLISGQEAAHEGDMLDLARDRNVEPVRIPELGRELSLLKDPLTLFKLVRLLRRIKPHIVHTHTAKAGTLGRIAALLARVPIVVHTFHGHVFSGYFSSWRTRLFLAIERFLARRSTRIIGVSEKCREDLLQLGVSDERRLIHIPLGLELARFPKDAERLKGRLRERLGLAEDVPLVAHVARLVPIKRHDVYLRAIAEVRARFPEARFLIVGDGETREALEALTKELHLEESVIWLGFVKDPAEVYADADIVALTSDDEGLPVAVIEALSSGRAVVATRVGGVPELVEEGVSGFLAERGDASDFARALGSALEDLERCHEMGRFAQARILKELSIDRLVDDLDNLYRECLEEQKI